MSRFRSALIALIGLSPNSRLKITLLRTLGWQVGRGVHIGPVFVWSVDDVRLADESRIGSFNVFRGLSLLRLGERSRIGQWNWISAAAPLRLAGASGSLTIGEHSALTSRHYLDASGGIDVGAFTTIAGVRSTFITHGINWRKGAQTFKRITVGSHSLISSNVNFAPGASVGDRTVIGMGATVSGSLSEPGLYLADRAALVKEGLSGAYFERQTGFVSSVEQTPLGGAVHAKD